MHLHNCATRYDMIKMCDGMAFGSMYFYPWHQVKGNGRVHAETAVHVMRVCVNPRDDGSIQKEAVWFKWL